MIFLIWFLTTAIVAALILAGKICYRWAKKLALTDRADLIGEAVDLGISLGAGLIFAILIYFLFPYKNTAGMVFLFAFLTDIIRFFHPARYILKREAFSFKKSRRLWFSSCLVLLSILEIFAFNTNAYPIAGGETVLCDRDSIAQVIDDSYFSSGTSFDDGILSVEDNNVFVIEKGEDSYKNICLDMSQENPSSMIYIRLSFSQDGHSFSSTYQYLSNPTYGNFNICAIPEEYASHPYIKVNIGIERNRIEYPSAILIEGVRFNVPLALNFNLIRVGLISLVLIFAFYAPVAVKNYRRLDREPTRKPYIIAAGCGLGLLVVFFVASTFNISYFYADYPISQDALNDVSGTNIYFRLFDALMKGQVHLDMWVDPKLAELSNPWDPAQRAQAGAYGAWDHAYYNGNYYCYYGIAPVLLVMFPIFILSGFTKIPSLITLQAVGWILTIPAFLILLFEVSRLLTKKLNVTNLLVLGFFCIFTTMFIPSFTFKEGYYHEGIYHTPIIYGLLFMDLLFAFFLMAYRSTKHRTLYLSLAALSLVLVVASRPNLALTVVLIVPFLIGILVKHELGWKRTIFNFLPALGILVVGAALICTYNYVRFDSIFEFGQSYQINVDQTNLTYGWNKILPSLVHFLFQLPRAYSRFPFFSCSMYTLSFDDCPYIWGYVGVFIIPYFLFLFCGGLCCRKSDSWVEKTFLWLFIPLIAFLGFTTYSKAGICARYLLEPYHIASIGATAIIIKLMDRTAQKKSQHVVCGLALTAGLFSSFLCMNLVFDTFDGWNWGDLWGFPLYFKEAFFNTNMLLPV